MAPVVAVPAALRKADISRFAQRASQLENVKPVVAYWCQYWILQQIVSRGLQNEDSESAEYGSNLMDKLEQTKAEQPNNDAISDDMAALAYIEQFGTETFQRADNAMKANKASRQTADTFSAAATFLELCQIWGPLESETASKIKFAKYHALRIAKAIKAGDDPNLSNPTLDISSHESPPLLPAGSDVRMLYGPPSLEQDREQSRQPSVEEIPDESELSQGHLAPQSTLDQSLQSSNTLSDRRQPKVEDGWAPGIPSPEGLEENYYQNPPVGDVSPIASSRAGPTQSVEGYFPKTPHAPNEGSAPSLSQAPLDEIGPSSFPTEPSLIPGNVPKSTANESLSSTPIDSAAIQSRVTPTNYHTNNQNAPQGHSFGAPVRHPQVQRLPVPAKVPAQPMTLRSTVDEAEYITDEEAILKAQKHARWAISALNFEDVKTAVKELRGALETLGAT